MTKEEIISYCKYYKGESKCPFQKGTSKSLFWGIEERYVQYSIHNISFKENLEKRALLYIKEHPNEDNIMLSKEIPIENKGIIIYIDSMISKWCPNKFYMLKDY